MKDNEIKIKGECLCGQLSYELTLESGDIYCCHCSKCRKISGSAYCANIAVDRFRFCWKKKPLTLKTFKTTQGWESPFCSTCGSIAPLENSKYDLFYVPAGSLEYHPILKVTNHKNIESKALWEEI